MSIESFRKQGQRRVISARDLLVLITANDKAGCRSRKGSSSDHNAGLTSGKKAKGGRKIV